MRFDQGKIRFDLIPWESLRQLAGVYTFGALKYADNNWKKFDDEEGTRNCFAAALRHIDKWQRGENVDEDSGLHHLAHVVWNFMACLFFADRSGTVPDPANLDWSLVAEQYAALRAEAQE